MKKATMASLLAVSVFTVAPGLLSFHDSAFAQLPGAQQPVTMEPEEFAMYNDAVNKQTTPQTQAPALEAYLAKYPKSSVKNDVLQRIMIDYSSFDPAKAVTAADNVLAVMPNNLQAYVIETLLRKQTAEAQTDAAAKQAGLDTAAGFAKKGLDVVNAPKPADIPQAQFDQIKKVAIPNFYATIAEDDLGKKDADGAIAAYKAELAAMPPDQLSQPGALQETYYLGNAYYIKTPPDYLTCAFYTTRAAALAPDQFKAQLQPLATYCYKKYHGSADGYADLVAMAKAGLTPPPDLASKVTPAPTDADQANALMKSTPDDQIPALAVSDREYVLQYGSDENKAKIWDAFKGKENTIPGLVIESSPTVVKLAVSDGAVQDKKADFTFNLKPLDAPEEPKAKTPAAMAKYRKEKAAYDKELADDAAATAVGKTVEISGTWSSYTSNPIMIIMDNASIVLPKPTPAAKAPVRHHP